MNFLNKILLVVLSSMILQGCQLGQDDDVNAVEEATDIVRALSNAVETINRSDLYRFILSGNDNFFELEDNLSAISVTGENNQVYIMEDTELESLTVSGVGNLVTLASGLSTRIKNITLIGSGHSIKVTEYIALDDNSTGSTITGVVVTP